MYENVCLIWIQHLICVTPHVFYTRTNACAKVGYNIQNDYIICT